GHLLQLVLAAGGQRHVGALPGEGERDRAADASAAAGDQRLLAFVREHRHSSWEAQPAAFDRSITGMLACAAWSGLGPWSSAAGSSARRWPTTWPRRVRPTSSWSSRTGWRAARRVARSEA